MNASPYRVSTITANGHIGCNLDILLFEQHARIVDSEPFGIAYLKFKGTRGVHPNPKHPSNAVPEEEGKKKRGRKGKTPVSPPNKPFDNQVTIIYKVRAGNTPNIKLFRNGNIHMTGIKSEEEGIEIIKHLGNEVRYIYKQGHPIIDNVDAVNPGEFVIRMINSDFSIPFRINRTKLHELLMKDYGCVSSFHDKYPGVKAQYFWNKWSAVQNGICQCTKECDGKGSGNGDGECKKVTVSVFHSGNVLITGANKLEQIDETYQFVTGIFKDKQHEIEIRSIARN